MEDLRSAEWSGRPWRPRVAARRPPLLKSIIARNGCQRSCVSGEGNLRAKRGTSLTDVGRHIHADEFAPEVVARSKGVAATAAEELKDHERWLKDFVASEEKNRKRHTSALKREQARYRRQLKRERTGRAAKRTAL